MADAAIWVDPGRCGGSPCITGTRITTASLASIVWDYGVDRALDSYPQLTVNDLKAACWYEATHGNKRAWRKRFGQWAIDHGDAMWRDDWASVPPPPQADDAP